MEGNCMQGNLAKVSFEHFSDDGRFPNSRLPVVIYRAAIGPGETTAEALEALFDGNGWPSQWRAGVFDYDHYHSTAHECLGIARGSARLRLGGPEGREFDVMAGDVIVLPAGTAHRRLSNSADFLVVGAYPPGQDWDLLRGADGERPGADARIAEVPLPKTDPVGGQGGPVLKEWG
jgi:uncharacterized protein YjlB